MPPSPHATSASTATPSTATTAKPSRCQRICMCNTRREPFGVTGHIIAWNYPMQLLARAVAPAIAVGNCAVVKPADETPRTAVELARLAVEAGLPTGVFNVVTGIGAEAGAELAAHPDVEHLGCVGSTQIGPVAAHDAADRVVPTTLELGGKSPQIV